VVLSCAHRYCWQCLAATATFCASNQCPVCRKEQLLDMDHFHVDSMLQRFLETYFPRDPCEPEESLEVAVPENRNPKQGFFYFFQSPHKYPSATSIVISPEPDFHTVDTLVTDINGRQPLRVCLFVPPNPNPAVEVKAEPLSPSWNVEERLSELEVPYVLVRLEKSSKQRSECFVDFEIDSPNGIIMGVGFKPLAANCPTKTGLSKRLDTLCSKSGKQPVILVANYQPIEELDDCLLPHIEQNIALVKHLFLINSPHQLSGRWHEISMNGMKTTADSEKISYHNILITNDSVAIEKVKVLKPQIVVAQPAVEDMSWELASRMSMILLSFILFCIFSHITRAGMSEIEGEL